MHLEDALATVRLRKPSDVCEALLKSGKANCDTQVNDCQQRQQRSYYQARTMCSVGIGRAYRARAAGFFALTTYAPLQNDARRSECPPFQKGSGPIRLQLKSCFTRH